MSIDTLEPTAPTVRTLADPAVRRILRFVISVTLAAAYAFYVNWGFSFLAVCITCSMMAQLPVALSFTLALRVMLRFYLYILGGLALMLPLQYMPVLGFALTALILFICFYMQAQGRFDGSTALLLILGMVTVPCFSGQSVDEAILFAKGFAKSMPVAFAAAWIAFAVLPEKLVDEAPKLPAVEGSPLIRGLYALRPVVVLMPLYVFMFASDNAIRYLIGFFMAPMIALQTSQTKARAYAYDLMFATVVGSSAALVLWWATKLWPSLLWFVMMIGLIAFWFGKHICDGPRGISPNYYRWSYGLMTLMIVIGPIVMNQGFAGDDATTRFYQRILDFVFVTAYAVVIVYVYDWICRAVLSRKGLLA